jgi:8-oxo-dGTP diphosphatase
MKRYTLLILKRNHELLLAMKKRGFGKGKWNGVGGKLRPGETVEHALIRECEEEIGVTPTNFYKVAIHIFTFPRDGEMIRHEAHVFMCDQWVGEPEETEEMAPRWFSTSEIPYDHMWNNDALWLPLVLRGKKLQCSFTSDEDTNMLSAHLDIVDKLD